MDKTYGLWTVVSGPHLYKYLCRCACGTEQLVYKYDLTSGKSTKCVKCGYKSTQRFAHLSRKLLRKIRGAVANAIIRCTDPSYIQYHDYGGRGIQVRFKDKNSFLEHLVTLEGHDNPLLVIDRINNDGHYEVGNLRFTTRWQSNDNKRKHK